MQSFIDQSYQCNHCLNCYPTERILRDHMRQHVHHYKCSFCSMTCSTPSILATHIRYRHIDHQPFKCPSCPHRYIKHYNLSSFFLQLYFSFIIYKMLFTDFRSKTQSDLREHLLTHDSSHRYNCSEPDCNFGARTRITLSRHIEKVCVLFRPIIDHTHCQ